MSVFRSIRLGIRVALAALLIIAAGVAVSGNAAAQGGDVLPGDKAALQAFYNATNGPDWDNNTGWDFSQPVDSSWHGVTVENGRVVRINLVGNGYSGNGLTGTLPAELGNLSKLYDLDLRGNDISGTIPAELGNLSSLVFLDLQGNKFSGSIPAELGNLSKLKTLILPLNNLSGSIPSELGNLSQLSSLDLRSNKLSGAIPTELGNLSKMEVLWLGANKLSGEIPVELGNLSKLERLTLGANRLSGSIPAELGNLPALWRLDLGDNRFVGAAPEELGDLANLTFLRLDKSGVNGALPDSYTHLTGLTHIYLDGVASCIPVGNSAMASWYSGITTRYPDTLRDCQPTPAQVSGLNASVTTVKLTADVTLEWDDPEDPSIAKWQIRHKKGDGAFGEWQDAVVSDTGPTRLASVGTFTGSGTRTFEVRAVNDDRIAGAAASTTLPLDLDLDKDNDRLIDVSSLAQLDAIRYDLDGNGVPVWAPFGDYGRIYWRAFTGGTKALSKPCGSRGCSGYELTNDLDFDTNANGVVDSGDAFWNGGRGWSPIVGKSGYEDRDAFQGAFDGRGYEIRHMMINRSSARVGLFAHASGSVRNLHLTDVDVNGRDSAGVLIGHAFASARISNVTADGAVSGRRNTGGLVGSFYGVIADSHFDGSVSGTNSVGGLTGHNETEIKNSYAAGSVSGQNSVGGLTGENRDDGKITNSYAAGSVSGQNSVGGLTGENRDDGKITNSYATGSVSGQNNVGGLAGVNRGDGEINSSYAKGQVNGNELVGGLVGINRDGGLISNTYATGKVISSGGRAGGLAGGNSASRIDNSYASGNVSGPSIVGGLVGINGRVWWGGCLDDHPPCIPVWDPPGPLTISDSYAMGAVYGDSNTGGLVGVNHAGGAVHCDDSYWNSDVKSHSANGCGSGKTTDELRSPTSNSGIYDDWSSDWDFGTSSQYPALKADWDGDDVATWQEFGSHRPSDPFTTRPIAVDGDTANIWREGVAVRFRKTDADQGVVAAGIGYRIAKTGEACHEWLGRSNVNVGETNGRATLSEDGGVYTLVLDRKDYWAFRPGGRVCIDVWFVNTAGKKGPTRRWHDIHMPPMEKPRSKPIKVSEARVMDGSVTLEFQTNPYDWAKRVGYRVAQEGNACHEWTGNLGVLWPGHNSGGVALSKEDGLWRLKLPVGEDVTLKPYHKYCVDVWTYNEAGAAPGGRRWRDFSTAGG